MIVSHKYRFIFIKTRKTAGTSIEIFLSQHCSLGDIVTPIEPHVEPHVAHNHRGYFNHMPGHEIRTRVGPAIWRDYFKFCVERNPWDKTLSYYAMLNHRQGGGMSFDDYLNSDDFCLDHSAYLEPGSNRSLLVDRVLRYEDLNRELAEVFAMLGIPFAGSLGIHAKSEYRTDRRPYRECYRPDQARRVASAFAVERDLFGYQF